MTVEERSRALPVRIERQWFQRYDDEECRPIDEWYPMMVASVRHGGREYGTSVDIERYEAAPQEWERQARINLQLAIDDDAGLLP